MDDNDDCEKCGHEINDMNRVTDSFHLVQKVICAQCEVSRLRSYRDRLEAAVRDIGDSDKKQCPNCACKNIEIENLVSENRVMRNCGELLLDLFNGSSQEEKMEEIGLSIVRKMLSCPYTSRELAHVKAMERVLEASRALDKATRDSAVEGRTFNSDAEAAADNLFRCLDEV